MQFFQCNDILRLLDDADRGLIPPFADIADLVLREISADLTEAQTFVKSDLTYPMMTKTLDGLEGALYSYTPAHAIQVFQEDIYGHTITYILCGDENGNYYSIFYDGVLPDVYDGVYISFTGLPVSPSGFENVGGGTTNVMVIIASSVAVI